MPRCNRLAGRLSSLTMFPYDSVLAAAVAAVPQSVPDVVAILETIGSTCADTDGLKWFNWLYLQVTEAVQARINTAGFSDPNWIAILDVRFAGFYFAAIRAALTGGSAPGCWQAVFNVRSQAPVTRLQFALAGMNAHINHDLPQAIVAVCQATNITPQHGTPHYNDYTALNATLDAIINTAKLELNVRLAGDGLPDATRLENLVAAWGIAAAREVAWKNAEVLWHLREVPLVSDAFLESVDATTAVASKALLVPV
ncbi:MAG TPA: DUF5995 family protein [Terracidiphilus sp.]|nr:DUF5995 family protein [Terracidiphilus sp.]